MLSCHPLSHSFPPPLSLSLPSFPLPLSISLSPSGQIYIHLVFGPLQKSVCLALSVSTITMTMSQKISTFIRNSKGNMKVTEICGGTVLLQNVAKFHTKSIWPTSIRQFINLPDYPWIIDSFRTTSPCPKIADCCRCSNVHSMKTVDQTEQHFRSSYGVPLATLDCKKKVHVTWSIQTPRITSVFYQSGASIFSLYDFLKIFTRSVEILTDSVSLTDIDHGGCL